jgi:hypothetical protein
LAERQWWAWGLDEVEIQFLVPCSWFPLPATQTVLT